MIQTSDIPVARAHLEGVVQKLLNWADDVPPLESLTRYENYCGRPRLYRILVCFCFAFLSPCCLFCAYYYSYYCSVVDKAFQSAEMLLTVGSIFGEPNEGEFE